MPDYHRILKLVNELHDTLLELIEAEKVNTNSCEGIPPPDPPAPKRKPRWLGAVPPEVRAERQRKHDWRFRLCIELNRDPFLRTFADRHCLSPSEVSRHLTSRARGVPPGSATGRNIDMALSREISELESLVSKRFGPEFFSKLKEGMAADNTRYGRSKYRRAAAHRKPVQQQTPRKSRRIAAQ
jgi:hypothetical protein